MKYGNLTIIEGSRFSSKVGKEKKQTKAYVRAVCDCGNTVTVQLANIKNGSTKSCGCLRIQTVIARSKKHGLSNKSDPTYISWQCMKKRCGHDKNYKKVTICDRWFNSFEHFLEDMGNRPLGTTLDRIDNNKGYSLENCRWATRIQQNRNKPGLRYITYKGQTRVLSEWAEILCLNYRTLKKRLDIGWSPERSFTRPVRKSSRVYRHIVGG